MFGRNQPTSGPSVEHVGEPHPYHSPTRRGLRAAWPWLLLAGALSLWVVESFQHGGDGVPEGEAAPELSLASTDGTFSLEAQRGQVVVMAFWATWCSACRAEAPVLARLQQRLADSGDRVVGVSVDELSLEDIARAASRLGMSYTIAKATPDVVERYGVELLPTIYVIGPDGHVFRTFTGTVSESTLLEAVEEARG